jgi:hypothetical protein
MVVATSEWQAIPERADIIMRFKQVRGKGVAQGMATHFLIDFIENFQRALGLPDLPVGDALSFSQGSQKRLNVLAGSVLEALLGQKIDEVFRPTHIESRTIRRYPVFLRARPEGFPKPELFFALTRLPVFNHKPPQILRGYRETGSS